MDFSLYTSLPVIEYKKCVLGGVMNRKMKVVHAAALFLLLIPGLMLFPGCQGSGGGDLGATIFNAWNSTREWFIMSGAKDRIESIRKGDAVINVVDREGTPVRGARIYYEQTNHEFLFGSNLTPLAEKGPNSVNEDWADAYVSLFNYGNLPFNWDTYEPLSGQTREALLTLMADWARKRGIATKGSPLVSAEYVPSWAPMSVGDMQTAQEKRVTNITEKFCGLVNYWDAVDGATTGARVNNVVGNWINAQTPQKVVVDALDWARSGCARGVMVINDFRTDTDYRDLLQNVVRQRGSFDAIGIQSHMHRGNWPLLQVWDICERFKDFNVPIHFTEVTVLSGAARSGIGDSSQPADWQTTQEGEIVQAAYVEQFYTLLFSHPSVQAITWWDFSDLNAWQGAPAGLLRKDMTRKPAYTGLLRLVRDQWWSRGNIYTDDAGNALLRGFYGSYKLVIEKDQVKLDSSLSLIKGLDNKLKLQLEHYRQLPPTPLWEQVWPYLVGIAVIVIIALIINWIEKMRRRI